MITILNWTALIIGLVASAGLLLHKNWRWGIGFLAVLYLSVFWLVQTHWPLSMAAVKLVTGWMVCAILGIASLNSESINDPKGSWPQSPVFRIFIIGIVVTSSFVLSLRTSLWLGLGLPIAWCSLLLIGMGLLQLGISAEPFRVVIGLLTVLAGFEVLYATVESSTLVAALLSSVNLGLALTGAYFLSISREENP